MKEYGIDYLKKGVLENVSLNEISEKDIEWCAAKWRFVMALTYAGRWTDEVFIDPEAYYAKVMVELEKRIKALGGTVKPMQSIEIPE